MAYKQEVRTAEILVAAALLAVWLLAPAETIDQNELPNFNRLKTAHSIKSVNCCGDINSGIRNIARLPVVAYTVWCLARCARTLQGVCAWAKYTESTKKIVRCSLLELEGNMQRTCLDSEDHHLRRTYVQNISTHVITLRRTAHGSCRSNRCSSNSSNKRCNNGVITLTSIVLCCSPPVCSGATATWSW